MGTYTTNKELFMPSVGEQGWGELVNNNFSTIDNFLKPITVSGSTYTFTGNQTGGTITATSISNSGTLTQTGISTFTGKLTANGGVGTKALSATSISNSGDMTNTGTLTSTGTIYANGGIEGEFNGDVAGSLYVNCSSVQDSSIGTYTVSTDVTSKSDTFTTRYAGNTEVDTNITVTDVVTTMNRGFAAGNVSVSVNVSASVVFTYTTGKNSTCALKIYRNGTSVASKPLQSVSSGSLSTDVMVSPLDVLSASVYIMRGEVNTDWSGNTITFSISSSEGKLYLA